MGRSSHKNKKYSVELKKAAVEAYLAGEGSLQTICKRYGISDHHVLRNWIAWYNGQKEYKQPSAARVALVFVKKKLPQKAAKNAALSQHQTTVACKY